MRVDASPPKIVALTCRILALGKIEMRIIAGRLVRVDASTANLSNEKTAHRERIVSNEFSFQTKSTLP